MTDDATLSDFAGDASDERDDSSADERDGSSSDGNAASERDTAPEERDDTDGTERTRADPNPSLSTYAWGEYVCARCDEESDRVWRDGDEFVCPDCKDW